MSYDQQTDRVFCPLTNGHLPLCCFHTYTGNNSLVIKQNMDMLNEYIFALHIQWNHSLASADPWGLIFNRAQWITVKSLCPDFYCLWVHSQMCLLGVVSVVDVITVSKVGYKRHHHRKLLHLHLLRQQFSLRFCWKKEKTNLQASECFKGNFWYISSCISLILWYFQ